MNKTEPWLNNIQSSGADGRLVFTKQQEKCSDGENPHQSVMLGRIQ